MSEHSVESAGSITEETCDSVHAASRDVSAQNPASPSGEKDKQSRLGAMVEAIFENIIGFAILLFIAFIAYSRFSYVSIRFLDGSEHLEATVYRWWGFEEEVFSLQLRDVDGTPRWMYGDVTGRLESINYDERFTSPFIIRLPWKKDPSEDSTETDTTVDGHETSVIAP
ncbi:MAG: hypothetical protein ACIAQF_03315 [Phycisphaerales bacterium JB065]